MLFLLVGEEFPLKKIKANTRPIKTLSSCYHSGAVLKYSQLKLVFIRNPFPSCTGDHSRDTGPGFLQPFRKQKSKHCVDITWEIKELQLCCQFAPSWVLAEMMSGGRGRDRRWPNHVSPRHLLQLWPSPPSKVEPRALWHSSSVQRGFLQRAKLWFMLYGTETTGTLFVHVAQLRFS